MILKTKKTLTTDKSTPNIFTGQMPFLSPNQERQSTEGKLNTLLKL